MPNIQTFTIGTDDFLLFEDHDQRPTKYNFSIFLIERPQRFRIGWGELVKGKASNIMASQALYIHVGNGGPDFQTVQNYVSPGGCDLHQKSGIDFRHRGIMTTALAILENHLNISIVPSGVPRMNGGDFQRSRLRRLPPNHPAHNRQNWGYG